MRALELTGEELTADVTGLQLFGRLRHFDAAAESLVLVDHERDSDAGGAQFAGELDGLVQLGPPVARVEIFSRRMSMSDRNLAPVGSVRQLERCGCSQPLVASMCTRSMSSSRKVVRA